jgi:hypothetical protein
MFGRLAGVVYGGSDFIHRMCARHARAVLGTRSPSNPYVGIHFSRSSARLGILLLMKSAMERMYGFFKISYALTRGVLSDQHAYEASHKWWCKIEKSRN